MERDTSRSYWQPGCTSCLKVKEFLREHSIEFESINVRTDPVAFAKLANRGVRSVPVLVRGNGRHAGPEHRRRRAIRRGQARAQAIAGRGARIRLMALLDLAAHLTHQIPDAALSTTLPGRSRTYLDLAYHVPMIVSALLDAAAGGSVTFEHFKRKPPADVLTAAIPRRS
jgi:glutaredoxin